jgi:endonuclease/exonuclease/phosphatase family metal-dependent hydrolase
MSRNLTRTATAAAAICVGLTGVTAGSAASASTVPTGTSTATTTTTTATDLRVGSFNVFGVNNDTSASGNQRIWKERRPVVVSQILGSHLDVVGVQEANQSSIYKSRLATTAPNQYMDLVRGLNAAGGHYAITNAAAYNCVVPASNQSCVYKNQGASGDTRIIYNTDTLSMVSNGSYQYHAYTGTTKRFLAYSVLRAKVSGKAFLLTDTHLDPRDISTRVAEWKELMTRVDTLKGTLPVVNVGDFNTTKYDSYTSSMLPSMKSHGYGDVLNQQFSVNPAVGVRAQSLDRAWINSYNGFRRDATTYSYSVRRDKLGNNIDWVFASNGLQVKTWSVVMNLDPATLLVKGVLPSDHSLVTATVSLP